MVLYPMPDFWYDVYSKMKITNELLDALNKNEFNDARRKKF